MEVVLHEQPSLETQRLQVEHERGQLRRQALLMADRLLQRLAAAEGSLIEDLSLMGVLSDMKETSKQIEMQRSAAAETATRLSQARQVFHPVAERGSILFFSWLSMRRLCASYEVTARHYALPPPSLRLTLCFLRTLLFQPGFCAALLRPVPASHGRR